MPLEPDISVPFPIEFMIRGTPRSHQSTNAKAKEGWRRRVGEAASECAKAARDFFYIDDRPLAATIFYFPTERMEGDVGNIVKLIADGMVAIIYPDDSVLERITVQKFEPGIEWGFRSLTPMLEQAINTEPPVVYVRVDDDLAWRHLP